MNPSPSVFLSGSSPRIAVVGAGAVGGYFGGLAARAGASVVMIGRKPFVEAVKAKGLRLDTRTFDETVRVEAATDFAAAHGADLVLFCVKTMDTVATAQALAPHLGPSAMIVSLQNGVDNAEKISAVTPAEVLPAVVYVAAAMPDPGHVKHSGRGDLVVGPMTERTNGLASFFDRAGVPCRISENIVGELWAKFICNCGLNAVSALGQATYGRIGADPEARRLVEAVVAEVLAVAHASRIAVPGYETLAEAHAAVVRLATQIAGALSSTAQDLKRGRRTEIDALNGFIVRRAAELGLAVPVNHALFTLVKLGEENAAVARA